MNLTADVKKTWQEYTEELYKKKDHHNPDNHDGVITHQEPDILECEVKGAIGSMTMNKASGGDGISAELFQILKDDDQQWPRDWKKSVFIPIPKRAMPKSIQTLPQLHSSHMLAKGCSKFPNLGFNIM